MRRKLILVLAIGIFLMLTAGCGGKNAEDKKTQETAGESAAEADSNLTENGGGLPDAENEQEQEVSFGNSDLSCTLPGGFEPYPGEEGIYVCKNYPKDSSTIDYIISESDIDISEMKQEEFKSMLESDYLDSYGDAVTIDITQYEAITIEGRSGLRIKLSFEFKGEVYEQLLYLIYNGNESHMLVYTQEKGGKWAEAFEKSGETITFAG